MNPFSKIKIRHLVHHVKTWNDSMLIRSFTSAVNTGILQQSPEVPNNFVFHGEFTDDMKKKFVDSMKIYEDFISTEEEKSLLDEIEPYIKRLRYENSHWDNAISQYRETEKMKWNSSNRVIIDRVINLAFQSGTAPLKYVHVLDLKATGVIKPHVDSVKFCGDTIAGISLLTDSIMRLRVDKERVNYVDILLKRMSLYIMSSTARYDYTHEILSHKESIFRGEQIIKGRRISVICRNEP
ncbi:UNVERIFIED_CONTAM: hypothetical protein PYX00_007907 [Menopon gallinae]|uniref:Alpha-ketoglutarate-dependent dioxygenase AlkB-like domain-containing protein n=1 Tax=Menopon gallinae TaxID=328185 RepID=A0AAW2HM42_9NEOP